MGPTSYRKSRKGIDGQKYSFSQLVKYNLPWVYLENSQGLVCKRSRIHKRDIQIPGFNRKSGGGTEIMWSIHMLMSAK